MQQATDLRESVRTPSRALTFYATGMSRAVEVLGPGDDAPPLAKVIAGTSLFLWLEVVYFGRLISWGL
jgi:hypothetical protein